jgi:hypothetical protein
LPSWHWHFATFFDGSNVIRLSTILEVIPSIKTVDCSASSVDMVFDSVTNYQESLETWPTSSFILFTNHLGDCDTDNERGLYIVDSTTFNNDTLTITAAATKSTFDNSTDEMAIGFTKPSAVTTKRAVTQKFLRDFPDELALSDSPVST